MITGVESRINRAETERALFNRNICPPDLPGDESLTIAAVDPGAGIGEVVRESVFVAAFFAYDNPTRARHREGGMMLQAMNFDYICKHVDIIVGEWGQKDKGTRRQGAENSLSLRLLFSLSPCRHSPLPLRLHSSRRGLHGALEVNASEMAAIIA